MRIAALLCAVGMLATPALGHVKEADNDIVSSRTKDILEAIPLSAPSMPRILASDRDVFVLMTAGAAYTEVTILGPKGTSGHKLAEALDASLPGPHGTATFTDNEDYAAAYASASNARCFAHSRHTDSPIGRVVAGIRAAGYVPHALLRVPRYAQVSATPYESQGTKLFHWYDVSACPATSVVSVEAHLTIAEWIWATVADLFPLLAILLNLTGIAIALVKRIPLDTRIIWYKRLGWRSTVGVMVVTGFLFLAYLPSETARPVADIWGGAASITGFTPHSMLAIPVLLFLSIPMILLHKPLFGESEDPVAVAEPTPDEKAVRKRISRYTLAVGIIPLGAFIGSWWLPHRTSAYLIVHIGAMLLLIWSPMIVQHLFRKQLAPFEKKDPDVGLTSRASSIALGEKRVTEVRVDDGQYGRSGAYATAQPDGSVLVSRFLADDFTSAEFDFAVAQAAAQGPFQRIMLLAIPYAIAISGLSGFWLFGPLRHHIHLEGQARMLVIMGPCMAFMFGGFYLFTLYMKRRFVRALREALAITRDLQAARSALRKMNATLGHTCPEGKDDPKLAGHLRTLQNAARELGISD